MKASLTACLWEHYGASLVAQMANNLPTVQETRVGPLGQEDSLKSEMTTHSSILAWEIPWTEQPGRLHEVLNKLDMTATEQQLKTEQFQVYLSFSIRK